MLSEHRGAHRALPPRGSHHRDRRGLEEVPHRGGRRDALALLEALQRLERELGGQLDPDPLAGARDLGGEAGLPEDLEHAAVLGQDVGVEAARCPGRGRRPPDAPSASCRARARAASPPPRTRPRRGRRRCAHSPRGRRSRADRRWWRRGRSRAAPPRSAAQRAAPRRSAAAEKKRSRRDSGDIPSRKASSASPSSALHGAHADGRAVRARPRPAEHSSDAAGIAATPQTRDIGRCPARGPQRIGDVPYAASVVSRDFAVGRVYA